MKALTISQPYASMIAEGWDVKPVENRRWHTSYRGPLAIHAGKGTQYLTRKQLLVYPTGCVIATCRLISCFNVSGAIRALQRGLIPTDLKALGWLPAQMTRLLEHEHTEGPFAFVLSDMNKLAVPVPATGQQGLWDWEDNQDG